MLHQLPELPPHLVWSLLTDEEYERLKATTVLPGPTDRECLICDTTKTFRFYESLRPPQADRVVVDYACPCADQRLLQLYLLSRGVGKHLATLFWADAGAVHIQTQQLVADYARNLDGYLSQGYGLYLHGEHGTGKSMMALLLLKRALAKGIDGYWTTFNDMLAAYQDTWSASKKERAWFDRKLRNVRLLVVDDVGREFEGRTTVASSVDAIFRTRVQNGLTTIVTTNLTDEKFIERYTKGMVSLTKEACLRHRVLGEDWRDEALSRGRLEIELGIRRPFTFGSL